MSSNVFYELPTPAQELFGWPWTGNLDGISFDPLITWPKISIVTPSFNQGKYIEETIRSVLLQNYPNLEYIIIDGGSTDESVSIIKKYEPWITYWETEPDRGQSHAINKGLEKCTGEIFNWLNSDDSYLHDTFYNVANAFIADPDLKVVSGFENHISSAGQLSLYQGTVLAETLEETIELCEISQPSTFFRLSCIMKVNGVSEDLHYIMDGEMWVKFLLMYGQVNFRKLKTTVVNFRFHENSKTVSNSLVNNFLFERCSIVTDLQRFAGVHDDIVDYYVDTIYKSPKVYQLDRKWILNESVITRRHLWLYFTQKYVMKQFRRNNRARAYWGIKQLMENRAFDYFLVKSILKLLWKR
ncbi:glycosyltransferase family 2 protein [Ferruginibacter paludis]|uniref:glycosyltransferase family 2 protein n=1 Tax=Ferruginibacter paludis TaxID=1310417 RepID=UPI0025B5FAE1|nr:glycosyltransferase family 2 protein [Ferruginibacter paludis]MDN3655868.1 glycosyltransferase family 2 protein [Ferruginibacter paludis]